MSPVTSALAGELYPETWRVGTDRAIQLALLPILRSTVAVFISAITTFCFVSSDVSGPCRMYRQWKRTTSLWRRGDVPAPTYNTVLVSTGAMPIVSMGLILDVSSCFPPSAAMVLSTCVPWLSVSRFSSPRGLHERVRGYPSPQSSKSGACDTR